MKAGEKGMAEDDMVGWHHRLDGHEFEHALGVGDGQGSLGCYTLLLRFNFVPYIPWLIDFQLFFKILK